ncbi:MAG: FkbM family methyltransferase [Candidatus Eiseniibacteriota bacterium]
MSERLPLMHRVRLRWLARKLRRSGLFDRDYYLTTYPDVAVARIDPELHYLAHGAKEGRDPSATFRTRSYVAGHPEIERSGVNPLLHYLDHVNEHVDGESSRRASLEAGEAPASMDTEEVAGLVTLLAFLRPGDQVLDIGARAGAFAVPFAARVGETGCVVAVEPNAADCELLSENVRRSEVDDRVVVRRAFVTDRPGGGDDRLECVTADQLADLLRPGRPLRVVRIHVEGMELAVLRSSPRLLRTWRPIVHLEVAAAALARFGATTAELDSLLRKERYTFFRDAEEGWPSDGVFRLCGLASLDEGGDCLAVPEELLWKQPVTP